jgi:hypothetical protein
VEYLRLSWADIEDQCKTIALELKKRRTSFDAIIGIARGGWIPARILSDLLDIEEIHTIRVKFYKAIGETSEKPSIVHPLPFYLNGKNVLLVDDIADTGKSLMIAIEHLRERKAGNIFVATLLKKPHSEFTPHIYVKETSAWVIFPWEVQETIKSIKSKAKSREEFLREMKKTGIWKK